MKIANCVDLKEHEERDGAPLSNTVAFVATWIAWQALGGFNSQEGRQLASVVTSVEDGVFRRALSVLPDELSTAKGLGWDTSSSHAIVPKSDLMYQLSKSSSEIIGVSNM